MKVLVVAHGYPPRAQGGSEIYAQAHARTLRTQFGDDVLVFTREADSNRPEYALRETVEEGMPVVWVNNTFSHVGSLEESYVNEPIADLFSAVVGRFRPDAAHLHHLTCLSTLLPRRLSDAGVPCFMTLHDYWLLCHRGQFFDLDHRPCSGPAGSCTRCIDASAAAPPGLTAAASVVRRVERNLPAPVSRAARAAGVRLASAFADAGAGETAMLRRLEHMREASRHVQRFFVPSHAVREQFIAHGFPPDRLLYSRYGFDHSLASEAPGATVGDTPRTASSASSASPLRIGFLGSLMPSKGPHVLLEAVERLEAGSATVHLFGTHVPYHGDDSYRERLAPLLRSAHVSVTEALPHHRIAEAFAAIDVLVVPSLWPENSPLVIQEAFLTGTPVVASDIGGIRELVEDGRNGLLFRAGDVEALAAALRRLTCPAGLAELSQPRTTVRSIEDDVEAMRQQYLAAASAGSRAVEREAAADRVHCVVLNYRTPDSTLLTVRSLLASSTAFASLLVVDNSGDESLLTGLRDVSDRAAVVPTQTNLGFSGGMNVGIRRALESGATHVLLVNSDVTVSPDCVQRLLAGLAAKPGAGIAGPTVVDRSTPDRIASMGLSYDLRSGRMRQRMFEAPLAEASSAAGTVDAVSGCVMLIERGVLERVGLLDESYFFGFEDLEFCLRAARSGYASIVVNSPVFHQGGRSLDFGSPERLYYSARNHLRLADSADASASALRRWVRRGYVVLLTCAFALRANPARVIPRLTAVWRGVRDYQRGRFGPSRRPA